MVAVAGNPIEVVNRSTGEVIGATPYVGKRMLRDTSDFVKLYDTEALLSFGNDEWRVFVYCMGRLDFGGKCVVDVEDCMQKTGMCRSSIFNGLNKLVARDALRREGGGRYWINLNIAFRGSRDELI